MGNKSTRKRTLSDGEIQVFVERTKFEPIDVQSFYEIFQSAADRSGRLDLRRFKTIFRQIWPNNNFLDFQTDAERYFMIFDRNHDGVLNFDEFLCGLVELENVEKMNLERHESIEQNDFPLRDEHNRIWNELKSRADCNSPMVDPRQVRLVSLESRSQTFRY